MHIYSIATLLPRLPVRSKMAYTIAILFFVIISILLAALMAGKTGVKDAENTKPSSETNQSAGGTTSEQGGAITSIHDHTLTTARPRQSSSVSPARGGSHARVQDRALLNASPNSSTPYTAGGSAVGSVNSPLESSGGGGGGSLLNRVSGSGGSPQGRKRGRDLDLNTVPPIHRGSPKAGTISPPLPPPPPPPKQVAHGGAVELPFPCSLCSRGFETPKGLCGHMRAHPERTWRGAHPPPVFSREEFHSVAASIVVESSRGSMAPDVAISTDQDKEAGVGVGESVSSTEERGVAAPTGDEEKQEKILPFDLNASPPKEEEENEG